MNQQRNKMSPTSSDSLPPPLPSPLHYWGVFWENKADIYFGFLGSFVPVGQTDIYCGCCVPLCCVVYKYFSVPMGTIIYVHMQVFGNTSNKGMIHKNDLSFKKCDNSYSILIYLKIKKIVNILLNLRSYKHVYLGSRLEVNRFAFFCCALWLDIILSCKINLEQALMV